MGHALVNTAAIRPLFAQKIRNCVTVKSRHFALCVAY